MDAPYFLFNVGVAITINYLFRSGADVSRFLDTYTTLSFLSYPVLMLFMFLFQTLLPIITGLFVDKDSIREALRISRVWKLIKSNYLQCFGVAFLSYAASYAASMVGFALFFVGMFFTMPIGMAIMHHFFGQAYRNAVIKSSHEPSPSQA